jgi:hypothetical protein
MKKWAKKIFLFICIFHVPSKSGKIEFSHFKGTRTCGLPNFRVFKQYKIDMQLFFLVGKHEKHLFLINIKNPYFVIFKNFFRHLFYFLRNNSLIFYKNFLLLQHSLQKRQFQAD